MLFEKIHMTTWSRKEYFEHYFTNVPCTYSMTVKLDITRIKKENRKLYPAMLYYITTVVNRHEEFRTDLDKNGEPGIYSGMFPSYTVFHKDTENVFPVFMIPWTSFEGFNLNLQNGYDYLLPVFTILRWESFTRKTDADFFPCLCRCTMPFVTVSIFAGFLGSYRN